MKIELPIPQETAGITISARQSLGNAVRAGAHRVFVKSSRRIARPPCGCIIAARINRS